MKAEEKAKEIYDNFDMYPLTYASKKELAIWHVEEVEEEIGLPVNNHDISRLDYWQEVKQHLLTLNQ